MKDQTNNLDNSESFGGKKEDEIVSNIKNGESTTEETDVDIEEAEPGPFIELLLPEPGPVTEQLLPEPGYTVHYADGYLQSTGSADEKCYENQLTDASLTKTGTEEAGGGERETWDKKADFLLSVIGFAVDLGNVWRFPYICYKNGGGAFLIPYFLMLIFLGLPLFYMELALGQFQRNGAITIWKHLCPMFTGVGIAICLVATYVGMYYNTIIAWALYYLIASFRSEVPWASCNNEWNTPHCLRMSDATNSSFLLNQTNPSALEYFHFNVLEAHKSTGIGDIGGIKWSLCACLLLVMAIVYFALWKGIKSSGKVVWITATVPYVVLLVLLVRGVTLPGAKEGIRFYLTPVWSKLLEVGVWLDAAAQIFFSLGPGFGTLLALSSYNKFNNNCYMDAMLTATINCFTSLLAGFVVFSVLGYMGHTLNVPIEDLAVQGPGLVFYVYPEAIATLDGSVFWSIIFFVLLITLGLDSTFGGLESVITAICDMSPRLARRRELVVFFVVLYCFLGGLPTTTYGGQYVITLLDTHAAPVALICICFVEAIAVNWFYGVQRFSNDIEKMMGFQPGLYWKICWAVTCPLFLFILFVLSIVAYAGLSLDGYVFPAWSEVVGWLVTFSSLLCIPGYMIYSFVTTPGSFGQRIVKMTQPVVDEPGTGVHRDVNGKGVLHTQSTYLPQDVNRKETLHTQSPYLPFCVQEKTNIDNSVMIDGQVPTTDETIDNTDSDICTPADSTDCTNNIGYGDNLYGNGNINRHRLHEKDNANEGTRTEHSNALHDVSLSGDTSNGCPV